MKAESPLSRSQKRLLKFLRQDMRISDSAVAVAIEHCEHNPHHVHVILYERGLLTLHELNRVFDWLELRRS